jgi:hypothetical protein
LLQSGVIAAPENDRGGVPGLTPPPTITERQLDYYIGVLKELLG